MNVEEEKQLIFWWVTKFKQIPSKY